MVKVLVATRKSLGAREDDFCGEGIEEGEYVWVPAPCGTHDDLDGARCSCMTEFVGVRSDALVSTAEVRSLPITRGAYLDALEAGHLACCHGFGDIRMYGRELLRVAESMDTGEVIERWGDVLGTRFNRETGQLKAPIRDMLDMLDDLEDDVV